MSEKSVYLPWLLLVGASLIWGSSYILIKWGLLAFTPLELGSIRLAIASMFFLPFVPGAIRRIPSGKWFFLILVAFLGKGIPAILYPSAQIYLSSGVTGVLSSLTPFFALLLGLLIFRVGVNGYQWLGVLIGLGGAAYLVISQKGVGGKFDLGLNLYYGSFCVLAAICYGLNANVVKQYLKEVNAFDIAVFSLVFAAIPYVLYLPFSDVWGKLQTHEHAWQSLGAISILAFFSSVVASVLYNELIHRTTAIFATSVTYLIPIVALLIGLRMGEAIVWTDILATGVILSGVYLIGRK